MSDLVQDHLGAESRKMIIDPFTCVDIPFQKADKGITASQLGCQC
jgi:hypothetical protein